MATLVREQNFTSFQEQPSYGEWAPEDGQAIDIVSPILDKQLQDLEAQYAEQSADGERHVKPVHTSSPAVACGSVRTVRYGGDTEAVFYFPPLQEAPPVHVMESLHKQAFQAFMTAEGYVE
ncbi:MAG TPA: hypothetical protein VF572_06625 [Candidatus Saccharimonadales bacterium]